MFKVIEGNPNAVRDKRISKEEMIKRAELIREDPVYYATNGHTEESVLALADVYDEASQLNEYVTSETIQEMYNKWVKRKEYEDICELLDAGEATWDGVPIKPEHVHVFKETFRELLVDGPDPQLMKILNSWDKPSNKPNHKKENGKPTLHLITNPPKNS